MVQQQHIGRGIVRERAKVCSNSLNMDLRIGDLFCFDSGGFKVILFCAGPSACARDLTQNLSDPRRKSFIVDCLLTRVMQQISGSLEGEQSLSIFCSVYNMLSVKFKPFDFPRSNRVTIITFLIIQPPQHPPIARDAFGFHHYHPLLLSACTGGLQLQSRCRMYYCAVLGIQLCARIVPGWVF